MQIDIEFDVYKALTSMRQSESDTYNAVLRRVLKLSNNSALLAAASGKQAGALWEIARGSPPRNAVAAAARGRGWDPVRNALLPNGAWFDNIFFPNGTLFRATYKGKAFTAEIRDECWVGSDGTARKSPSAAAGAISNTNVNGWRFWFVRRPFDESWQRMDSLKT